MIELKKITNTTILEDWIPIINENDENLLNEINNKANINFDNVTNIPLGFNIDENGHLIVSWGK